jgi:hypothetical protein
MRNKENNIDMKYILYGEKRPGCLGLIAQSLIAIFKYLFAPNKLNIGDGRRLNEIHKKTGISFPIESERVNKK